MYGFANTTCTLEIKLVFDQTVMLRQRGEATSKMSSFEYSGTVVLSAGPELNHARYSDLYYATIKYYKGKSCW